MVDCCARPPSGSSTSSPTPSWRVRPPSPPARPSSASSASSARSTASRSRPSARRTSSRRATSRSRSSPPGSGTSATAAATRACAPNCWPGAARSSSSPSTCATATTTGSPDSTATGSSPASATSASRSRSGTASTPRAPRITRIRSWPPRTPSPSIRAAIALPGSPNPSAARPTASWAIPTSWTPGRRPRSPRSWRAVGRRIASCSISRSPWTWPPRPTTSSAPGCSPASCGPTSKITPCRGPTPRSRASSWIPIARRCPNPRATSSCRARFSTSSAPTPSAGGPP